MQGQKTNLKDNGTNKSINKVLSEYNSIIKENEEIYHKAAKSIGISNCAFWIFYMLREEDGQITQSNICDVLYQPKQTVNSALKKLSSEGYIKLITIAGSHSKQISFTEKGRKFAKETIDKVIECEQKALSGMDLEEQQAFFILFRKFTKLLKENMEGVL